MCIFGTGAVLGMVTSGLTMGEMSFPITYGIPSEILRPSVDAISFNVNDGERPKMASQRIPYVDLERLVAR